MIIKNRPIIAKKLGHWLNLIIPKIVVQIIHSPAKVAYVYAAEIVFITWDKQYIHKIIVVIHINENKNLENPSDSFAKIFETVPKIIADKRKEYVKIKFIYLILCLSL